MAFDNTSKPSLKLESMIGSGAFGTVYRGRYNFRNAAIKKFRLSQCTMSQDDIDNEIRLLQSLQYRHIIQFYGVVRQQDEILLVTDFAERGSLKRAIDRAQLVTWAEKERIAQEMADGLAYIHHEGVLHRDLKSANVLLTRLMEVKLCDFGLAVVKKLSDVHTTNVRQGTIRWMAPELLSDPPLYSTKSDVYALGMVMWEMASMCTTPFKAIHGSPEVAMAVQEGRREQLPEDTPAEYRLWVEQFWKQDPSQRPKADEMVLGDDTRSIRWSTSIMTDSLSITDTVELAIPPCRSIDNPAQKCTGVEPFTPPSSPISMGIDHQHRELAHVSRMAQCNVVGAQVYLAEMYASGKDGIEKDEQEAFTWYLRAAELGHLEAMRCVGNMYSVGQGTVKNTLEANKWHRKATLQEQAELQEGGVVSSQQVTPSSGRYSKTMTWFRRTSQKSLTAVGLKIIATPTTSRRTVSQTIPEVTSGTMGNITERRNSAAMSDLSDHYSIARDSEQSVGEDELWSTKAVNEGHPTTQFNLGMTYAEGRGVEQSDEEAIKWFTKAANQDHPGAQLHLGLMHKKGRGIEKSNAEAAKWFTKAASQGDADAQFCLGVLYERGGGVRRSDVEAAKWFIKAAKEGHPGAQYNLGMMYQDGRGVERNKVEAAKWLSKAASQDETFS
ncbi:hypothetical protein DFQ27_004979 [Actinomortierella ambigua]|uniref:Protein kinase domain-containing protein n=1 Tax=Actinomortierella ambigua TaxID=1343610 RepID=A0A9P6QHW4_9FUNG|nr:hypothetical protein DFQ27_004979 [Actinomortierella ambigua]